MSSMEETKDIDRIKRRDAMYRMMISQLFYDGYKDLAVGLAAAVKPHPACPPSDKLLRMVSLGLQHDDEANAEQEASFGSTVQPGSGIDLEFETEVQTISPEVALYETCYVTAHKGPCRAAAFHNTGQLIATGSQDASIKVLDVERMLSKSATPADIMAMETPQQQVENHPVIRTLYDHNAEVTCLDFHPFESILASGGLDFSIRFFEYSKPSVKKAFKSVQEAAEPMSISFHPSGDFLLVGTKHPSIRLYDVNTFQSFVASNPKDQHKGSITAAKWSPNANMFVSCSVDGAIKIWDGVSNKCINTFHNAHDGKEVTSVAFSRNSKYVLSGGRNSLVKLWELSTNRCLIVYTGAGATGAMEHSTVACFNHTEDYVLFPDEKTLSLCSWDSRNAERQKLLSLGHNNVVQYMVHSPTGPAFVSCSDDYRARFWYRKASQD